MSNVRSHYDTLKVTRDAPPEVIRAAYRSLSQKFHPDLNAGNAESEEAMKSINAAYDVLSDPSRRQAHDAWIASAELHAALAQAVPLRQDGVPSQPRQQASAAGRRYRLAGHALAWFALVAVLLLLAAQYMVVVPPADRVAVDVQPDGHSQALPHYRRPLTAPNGAPWPVFASYVTGYQILKTDGLSKVTIENDGRTDVFLKLVALEYEGASPVRHAFVPAYGRFAFNQVAAGTYDIRFRDLGTGRLARSEYFRLKETARAGGVEFTEFTISLAEVRDSKMQGYPLAEGEF
jgi:DnaJ-domain-containing protein 1